MTRPRLLIYVQHLVGIGHFKRASVIARAAAERGLDVTLMTGGQAPRDANLGAVKLTQLAPAHTKENDFTVLLAEDGSIVDDSWRSQRSAAVLEGFRRIRPDVVMIELFPFGRRKMRFELLPLLCAAREAEPRPIVVSSIRDILVGQENLQRADEVCQYLEDYFDHVLVHGDPKFIRLNATFPRTAKIENLLTYTGYVVDKSHGVHSEQSVQEVLVSAGGGATGQHLFDIALACRPLTELRDRTWRFLVGTRGDIQSLRAQVGKAATNIIVESARSDFPALLKSCALSISHGGYNTTVETLQANAPSVIVPYSTDRESEQSFRANLLAKRNLIETISEAELSPETLAKAVNSAFQAGRKESDIDLSGAEVSARLLDEWSRPSEEVAR